MAERRWGAVLVVGTLWLAACGPPDATTAPARPAPAGLPASDAVPTTARWERLPEGPLSPRGWTAATWSGTEVVLVGGTATNGPLPDPAQGCPEDAECDGAELPHIAHRDGAALDLGAGIWRSLPPVPDDVPVPTALWPTAEGLVGPGARLVGDVWSPLPGPRALVYAPVRWTGEELVAVGWEYALGERGGVGQVVVEELRPGGQDAWSQTAWPADPPGLETIETVWTGEEVVVFVWRVCADGAGDCTATVRWDPAADTWGEIAEHPGPAPRSPGWDGEAIIAGSPEGLVRIDPATGARTALPPPPDPLQGLDPIVRPGAVALVEGEEVAVLDLDAMTWSRAPHLPFSAPASGRAVLWVGEELLAWGGLADPYLAGSVDTADGYLLVADERTPGAAGPLEETPAADAGSSDPSEPAGDADPSPSSGEAAVYECGGNHHPPSVWLREEPLDEVEHPAREDLLEQLEAVGVEGWFLLAATEESLVVARREQRPPDDVEQRTHDVVAMGQLGEGWGPGWHVMQWSPCTPRLVLDGLGAAELWLDGEPDPAATSVRLVAVEQSCAGGRAADDRVEIVEIVEQPDAVTVILGVRPVPGGAECPSNPPTGVTVALSAPLGGRPVLDGTELPPRPLEPAPNELG